MSKIFYFKDENKYKRLYFLNFKLFKIKKYFSDNHIKIIIKNIESQAKLYKSIQNEILPTPSNLILESLKELKDFYFLPNKGNLGDGLIANSEFQIFNKYKDNIYMKLYNYTEFKQPFNFVYGGGGIFIDVYKEDCKKIFDIFKNKFLKRCIILSSSFYNIPELIEMFDERFTIFCREKNSYDYLINSKTKAKVYLCDDMVFATDIKFYYNSDFTNNQLNNLKKNLTVFSVKQIKQIIFNYFFRYISVYNKVKNISSAIKENNLKTAYLLRNDPEKHIKKDLNINSFDLSMCGIIEEISCLDNAYVQILSELFFSAVDCADVVVTDRLHIGIAASLLNKEVFYFDNSYKKISGVYEQSMKSMKNVHLLKEQDLENIDKIIKCYNIRITANDEKFKNLNLSIEQFLTKYLTYKN